MQLCHVTSGQPSAPLQSWLEMQPLLYVASDFDDCLCSQPAAQTLQVVLHLLSLEIMTTAAEEKEEVEDMLPLISFIQGQGRSQVMFCRCSRTVTARKCAVQRLDDWFGTWRR